MNKVKILFILLSLSSSLLISAKDYKASLFGVKSDGITLNTGSIQKAIDFISENGGGRLVFYVGRYLTGTIELKSNVTIILQEGAVLVASASVYNYYGYNGTQALIVAENQQNIGITGKGVIEGQGEALLKNISEQRGKGYLSPDAAQVYPALIAMSRCEKIAVEQLNLRDACGDVQAYSGCKELSIDGVTVKSRSDRRPADGLTLTDCNNVKLNALFFDVSGEELSVRGDSRNISVTDSRNADGKQISVKEQSSNGINL